MIELNGAGAGGQVLRTALSLSLCTGQAFRMTHIRAGRPRPGLMRQHLTAVQAAARVGGVGVLDAEVGSTALTFVPGTPRPGEYAFAIGTAGSCALVVQTLLPVLWNANGASSVSIAGGTHNIGAPCATFLQRAFLPLLARHGLVASLAVRRHGFYPRGGGEVLLVVDGPARASAVSLTRPAVLDGPLAADVLLAGVPPVVGERELATLQGALGIVAANAVTHLLPDDCGPGNAVSVTVPFQDCTEVYTGLGRRGVRAEAVAGEVAADVRARLADGAAVGEHLADQLLLPMALGAGGVFTTARITAHVASNAQAIRRFLPVGITFREVGGVMEVEVKT